ncbi:GNAT family N-acetyltransferase [Brevibacillus sp. B_LB10_24]|uniref:GNAT family N-acetyltransferase n=1 Tax=Brevibacillus sp. B_LB10_24 TaxID=3380645 RepID=UPI0038BB4517
MGDKVTVRQSTIQDLAKLVPVFDSYREYFGQEKNPAAAEKFLFEKYEHRESIVFIAEQQSQIVGFAQLYPSFSSLSLQRIWILNDFFIMENDRGKGIGKQLIGAVIEYASLTKAKGIELSVEHTNTKAWMYWEKQGFHLDEEFRYYMYKLRS